MPGCEVSLGVGIWGRVARVRVYGKQKAILRRKLKPHLSQRALLKLSLICLKHIVMMRDVRTTVMITVIAVLY